MLLSDKIFFAVFVVVWGGLLVTLVLVIINARRKAKTRKYFSSHEVFGAIVSRNGALKGQIFPITKDGAVLGRDKGLASIVIEDNSGISRQHTRVFVTGGRAVVQDINSKNGTYVNDRIVGQKELSHGDVISLGRRQPSIFQFLKKPL